MHTNAEWDPRKAEANLRKHGVDFTSAAVAIEDENGITIDDSDVEEPRFVSIGMDDMGKILVVVYTADERALRIISARKATKRERKQYAKKS